MRKGKNRTLTVCISYLTEFKVSHLSRGSCVCLFVRRTLIHILCFNAWRYCFLLLLIFSLVCFFFDTEQSKTVKGFIRFKFVPFAVFQFIFDVSIFYYCYYRLLHKLCFVANEAFSRKKMKKLRIHVWIQKHIKKYKQKINPRKTIKLASQTKLDRGGGR